MEHARTTRQVAGTAIFVRGSLLSLPLVMALAAGASAQVTLQLSAVSDAALTAGAATVRVLPGDTVEYRVEGQLGGDGNQGLAMFAFDLGFSGGALTQPVSAPGALAQFVAPLGVNNPDGFGGTLRSGRLLQVGGAMNTIANTFAPTPSGTVVTGLAGGALPEVLATGSLSAPSAPGTYVLEVQDPFANALDLLQPAGFWSVLPVEVQSPTALTIEVLDCGVSTYCSGKLHSAGCVPAVSGSGSASLGGTSTLFIGADGVLNGQTGLFVWSLGPDAVPLYGGTLCVAQPLFRVLEPMRSGGTGAPGTNCEGAYSRTIDAMFLASAGLQLGDSVYCQWIFRDPVNTDGTGAGLTDALRFTVCP